jgi:hypothetical protein
MDSALYMPASPAIALLQQLENLLRDPVLGPPVALQVAAAIDEVVSRQNEHAPYPLDKPAYARLWSATDTDRAGRQELQALISLAAI